MGFIKGFFLLFVFAICSWIGFLFSRQYQYREKELKELKNAFHLLETKIRFTAIPLPEIFEEIAKTSSVTTIAELFRKASCQMQEKNAKEAWEIAVEQMEGNLKEEDRRMMKEFGRLLGKTDIDGQMSQIELTKSFLEEQIEKAKLDRKKNEKLYKSLGMVAGLAIVIVLV